MSQTWRPTVLHPLLWACGTVAALCVAFIAVRVALDHPLNSPPDWRAIEQARELDQWARQVSDFVQELESVSSVRSVGERSQRAAWARGDFAPRVKEFRLRMLANPRKGAAYQALLSAADRLGAAAADPADARALHSARAMRDQARALVDEEIARVEP